MPKRLHLGAVEPQFEVSFTLTSWNCVDQSLYEEYAVPDFEAAARKLFQSVDQGIFPCYRVFVPGARRHFKWYVKSPLRRFAPDLRKRGRIEGTTPGSWSIDDTLVELSLEPAYPNSTLKSVPKLRVGGSTPEQAEENWRVFAKALKQILAHGH